MFEKCAAVGEHIIKYVAMVPLLLITVMNLLYQNTISFDHWEKSTITNNGGMFFLALAIGLVCMGLAYILLKKVPETLLFVVLALGYVAAGIYLVQNIEMAVRFDSAYCYWNASNFLQGNYANLQEGAYFYQYPHQMGLVLYNTLMVKISENQHFMHYLNLMWTIVGNFCIWRSAVLLYENKPEIRKMIIFFSFAFLPQLFYLFFIYGVVPGLGMILIALYCVIHSVKKDSKIAMAIGIVFIALACLVRMNYAIAGIAIIILCILRALKEKKVFYAVAAMCMVLAMLLPRGAVNSYYEKLANTDLTNGMPSVLFVAMGLQENEEDARAPGWYNGYNERIYGENYTNPELMREIAMQEIKDRLRIFADNPGYACSFFKQKLVTTWCEPTYQSVWSGPVISMEGKTEVLQLHDLYSGGGIFQKFAAVMSVFNTMLFLFSGYLLFKNILVEKTQMNFLDMYGILFFLGGFLFHFAWETKSQYVFPYMVCLLPVAAHGLCVLCEDIKNIKTRMQNEKEEGEK